MSKPSTTLPSPPTAVVRWVLVTGGAQRLGRALCLAFARAGWNVLCHYHGSASAAQQTCAELEQLGAKAHALQADIGEVQGQEALMRQALALCGDHLAALVNNASLFEPDSGLDVDAAVLQRQLQVNLAAPLQLGSRLAQAARRHPSAAPAALIHVLDQKVFNLNPDYFSYTVSKLALERAVALQAQALAPQVRVNAVAPGLVYVSGPQDEENFEKARRVNLLRSPTDPKDVAQAAVFLAENQSITGITLTVDKGQHLVPLERDIMFVAEQLTAPPP